MLQQQNELIDALYQAQYPQLFSYAERYLKDPTWAQDVVHDVFYEALQKADKLESHENPGGWLMLALQNKVTDNNRMHLRYIKRFLSLDEEGMEGAAVYEPDELADSLAEIMCKIRQALNEEEFHLLRWLVLEQRSHADVARELGVSVWTTQKRLERVRKKLYAVFPERREKKAHLKKI